jgi:hypothetical protein
MAELIDVANAMFTNKTNWVNISDEDKEKFFFIFNRYFAKKYPEKSQLLNLKVIDKVFKAIESLYSSAVAYFYPRIIVLFEDSSFCCSFITCFIN